MSAPVIEPEIALVEEIFSSWQTLLGADYLGYRNHVYRVIHFCFALHPCDSVSRQKVILAACFHDIGIWTHHTVDYLPPSIESVTKYLQQHQLDGWVDEICLMIDMHHKLRRYSDQNSLVEIFRKGDLVDFSLGWMRAGVLKSYVHQVKAQFPNAGFHRGLLKLAKQWFIRHPLQLPPFMKW